MASIHPNPRSKATKLRKKVNAERNRKARAALYSEYATMGNSRHQTEAPRWHTTLRALSNGNI